MANLTATELEHEFPSDDELRRHLAEHLKSSPLCWTAQRVEGHECRALVGIPELEGALADLHTLGVDRFIVRATESILSSLRRLNNLPRSDPFWLNTNNRPTIFKLCEFCKRILRTDPGDKLALWTLGSLQVFFGSDDFGQHYWKDLYAAGDFDMCLAVFASLLSELNVGAMEKALSKLLTETDSIKEVTPLLERLRGSSSRRIAEWAEALTGALSGRPETPL